MKSCFLLAATGILGAGLTAFAQAPSSAGTQTQGPPQVMGRGRGGAPFAWNDRNKDGICDITGQPVGQGRPIGFGRGRGRGRGPCGAGWGRGMARGWRFMPPAQTPSPQPQAQPEK